MVNEWTRDDLPNVNDLVEVSRETLFAGRTDGGVAVLDAVAAHLNAHHPKPEFEGYCTCNGYDSGGLMGDCGIALHRAQYRANLAEADADRWRRAHEIVEGERDQARDRCRELDADLAKCMSDFQDVEDERDAWRARAEDAKARTAVSRAEFEDALELWLIRDSSMFKAISYLVCGMFGVEDVRVDPVEEKAIELWEVAYRPQHGTWDNEQAVIKDRFRDVAAHVLGQEAAQ